LTIDHVMGSRIPDYELADSIELSTAEQHRAVGNLVRAQILGTLNERAATISQLAEALGVLKGSTSYHVRLLERAGLVRVVRTRKVRGVVERYYGRTARRFEMDVPGSPGGAGAVLLRTAAAEVDASPPPRPTDPEMTTLAHARLDPERAHEFRRRFGELAEEFRVAGQPDGAMYGLVVGLYRTGVGPTANEAAEDKAAEEDEEEQ
jgi:DNA-binding transcriptional ArsR family regulator